MDICKPLFSPEFVLTEEIARQVFEILPESGPLIVIMDTDDNIQASNSEEFAKLNISKSFLQEVCVLINDGVEPVISNSNNCSIIAEQLATEYNNYGYAFVILPEYDRETILSNIDLIETLLNQIGLIAYFIEKNNLHNEFQMEHYRLYSQSEAVLN